MGLESLLKICFLLMGYASIRAIESSTNPHTKKWLTNWVMSTLITLLGQPITKVLIKRNFLWPYAKVIITCWLVIRYVGGVAYVYECVVIPCCPVNPLTFRVWFILWRESFILNKPDDFLAMASKYIEDNGSEALEELIGKGPLLHPQSMDTELPQLLCTKRGQNEWNCPHRFVSTCSEASLKEHLWGKRHTAKEELFKEGETLASLNQGIFDLTNMFNAVGNFNHIFNHHLGLTAKTGQWCKWKKPLLGWTKLNTDGSVDPKHAGLGGLLRDHTGKPICAFVSKVPREGSFYVELWAIWRGLKLASGLGLEAIWVESDSLSVVKVINGKQPYPRKAASCLKHIWNMLEKFEHSRVSYARRQVNRAADHLAKMNLHGSDIVLWPTDFPSSLCKIIEEDANGMKYKV